MHTMPFQVDIAKSRVILKANDNSQLHICLFMCFCAQMKAKCAYFISSSPANTSESISFN